jgi:hypothetical protein
MKTKKYLYERILQQYNNGWDDIEYFQTGSNFVLSIADRKELNFLIKEYRIANNAPLRVINRKTKMGE